MTGLVMSTLDRRAFLLASAGALSAATGFAHAAPAPQCSSPNMPAAVVPNRLLVDCASQRNFQLFRANPEYVRLTGLVSVNVVQGKTNTYPAGTMMVFPQLTPKGVALGTSRAWPSYITARNILTGANSLKQVDAIRMQTLPEDDYFCQLVLNAPWTFFIGFSVDAPSDPLTNQTWVSNVDKLADGKGVKVTWASANLNAPWFGGSRWIPAGDQCQGKAWRSVIVDGLSQASVGAC